MFAGKFISRQFVNLYKTKKELPYLVDVVVRVHRFVDVTFEVRVELGGWREERKTDAEHLPSSSCAVSIHKCTSSGSSLNVSYGV